MNGRHDWKVKDTFSPYGLLETFLSLYNFLDSMHVSMIATVILQ